MNCVPGRCSSLTEVLTYLSRYKEGVQKTVVSAVSGTPSTEMRGAAQASQRLGWVSLCWLCSPSGPLELDEKVAKLHLSPYQVQNTRALWIRTLKG